MSEQVRSAQRFLFIGGLIAFGGLFILGQTTRIWLPFWIVGTLGAAAYAIVLVAGPLRGPRRYWRERGAKGTIETTVLVAVAGYTLWISQGHLREELVHFLG